MLLADEVHYDKFLNTFPSERTLGDGHVCLWVACAGLIPLKKTKEKKTKEKDGEGVGGSGRERDGKSETS